MRACLAMWGLLPSLLIGAVEAVEPDANFRDRATWLAKRSQVEPYAKRSRLAYRSVDRILPVLIRRGMDTLNTNKQALLGGNGVTRGPVVNKVAKGKRVKSVNEIGQSTSKNELSANAINPESMDEATSKSQLRAGIAAQLGPSMKLQDQNSPQCRAWRDKVAAGKAARLVRPSQTEVPRRSSGKLRKRSGADDLAKRGDGTTRATGQTPEQPDGSQDSIPGQYRKERQEREAGFQKSPRLTPGGDFELADAELERILATMAEEDKKKMREIAAEVVMSFKPSEPPKLRQLQQKYGTQAASIVYVHFLKDHWTRVKKDVEAQARCDGWSDP